MSEMTDNCPVCNCAQYIQSFSIRTHVYYSCNSCGVLFLGKEPDPKFSGNNYDDSYFSSALKDNLSGYMDYAKQSLPLRRNFRTILSHIKSHLSFKSPISVLDVGCAYGFFLDEARKAGMSVHGLDLSASAVRWMKDNLNIEGTVGLSYNAPEGPFDIVTAIEVIEHIKEPDSFIKNLRKRLKDGGLLVIHTGAVDSLTAKLLGRWWWYLNPPDHCTIFSRQALKHLITENGFEILDHRLMNCSWVGLNNIMLKLARIFESRRLGRFASKLPAWTLPVPHNCVQLLIARKIK
ncbi:MAG: class I SAM-dependent methyltransferase [Nitrospirae bacterium]|nr:class I SAM-dependent methyltransferase [Nitrospirota bacterium]